MSIIRTRFAPSPTGFLHVGGARTALYSWLYARRHQGQFILRIEDTDLERSTPESVQAILDGMQWLNLDYDEGPFYQTQRFDRYKEVIQQWLEQGKAYRCFCSKERLEQMREQQTAAQQKPRYDGHCRELNHHAEQASFVVRFRNPLAGEVIVDDQVHGRVVFKNAELDDLIIARSDGSPTYNFTVVVDDYDMRITHVIRGDDHLNNTPRQINMLYALDATPPIYAHVPMILGSDGKKLSKRHGTVGVMQYREDGYLPDALLNYLVRLGWSHGDQEIFSRQEMIELFDITSLNKSPAAFNTEKLQWLNQHYMKSEAVQRVIPELEWQMQHSGIDTSQGPKLADLIAVQAERSKTLAEMAAKSRYFYADIQYDAELLKKHITPDLIPVITVLQQQLTELADWTDAAIHQIIEQVVAQFDLKLGKLAQPVRILLTGGTVSPPINATIRLLGKMKVIQRLQRALVV